MAKRTSGVTKRLEVWTISDNAGSQKVIVKNAVRHSDGTFHGATNFRVGLVSAVGKPVA